MKLISIAAIGAISTIAFGATLLEDAKNAGMKPIPKDKKELNKLIDNPKKPYNSGESGVG